MCYYLVSPRGSDREMQDALGLKVSQFVSLMGDEQQTQEEKLFVESRRASAFRRLVEQFAGRGSARLKRARGNAF